MSLYTHNFKEVVHHLHSAIAVDYDYRGRKIFWSDVGSEKIFWLVRFGQLLFLVNDVQYKFNADQSAKVIETIGCSFGTYR